jgi:hypothetical protein
MTHFTPIDTALASTFLRSVNPTDGSFSEHFLMPITGFQNNGQAVMPKGFMDKFDLYLTLDATGGGGVFNTLNVTLWADPKANDGAVSVDASHDPSFANGTKGDFILATGTKVSASLAQDSTGTRHANFVEMLTPTELGSKFSDGTLKAGMLMQEILTSPASKLSSIPQPDGSSINLLNGGTATIDFQSADAPGVDTTILVSKISGHLAHPHMGFIGHHSGDK